MLRGWQKVSSDNGLASMKTYIDCGSGVAGDMLLGALVGLGLSPVELQETLRRVIPVRGWRLRIVPVERRMWPAWSLRVIGDRPFGSPDKMLQCVRQAKLPPEVRRKSSEILLALKLAERQAHGSSDGHFDPRGLGRIDTLVDIVGCSWGFWR